MSDSPSPLLFSLYEQASVGCGGESTVNGACAEAAAAKSSEAAARARDLRDIAVSF